MASLTTNQPPTKRQRTLYGLPSFKKFSVGERVEYYHGLRCTGCITQRICIDNRIDEFVYYIKNNATDTVELAHERNIIVDVPAHNAYLQQQNLELLAEIKKLKEENENLRDRLSDTLLLLD
jgi:hypothetical protein